MEEKALAYLRFMIKKFYVALIITLLFGFAGWYYGQKTPLRYETQAYVTVTQLSYTLLPSPAGQLQNLNIAQVNTPALAMLVKNPIIAKKVINKLGEKLDNEQRNPDKLLTQIEGDIPRGTVGLIEISVSDNQPERAQTLANAWAETYVEHLNSIYKGERSELLEVKVTNPAYRPLKPVGPSASFLAILGLIAGAFISLFFLLVWAAASDLWALIVQPEMPKKKGRSK